MSKNINKVTSFEGHTFHIPDGEGGTVAVRTCWVPLESLNIDTYQRNLDNTHVENIVKNFDPYKLKAFNVNRRPSGKLYVWDGQQEQEAIHRLKESGKYNSVKVRCDLCEFPAKTDADARKIEARKYREKNGGSKPNTPGELMKALVVEGNNWAVNVQRTLKSYGLAWNEKKGKLPPNAFPMEAIAYYMKKYKEGDPTAERFKRLMKVLSKAFRDPTSGDFPVAARYVPFLKGLAMYLHTAPASLDEYIIEHLADIGADDIKNDAVETHRELGYTANQPSPRLVLERLKLWMKPLQARRAS